MRNFIPAILTITCLAMTLSKTNAQEKTLIFVSYSMPDGVLKTYHHQAQKSGATLVMRGLKDDSFVATQKEAKRLEITYDINPELFDEYGVTRVPTIVGIRDAVSRKVVGNIPLETARSLTMEHQGG